MQEIDNKIFVNALNRLAVSEDGKVVLAAIKDLCGWDMTYLSSTDLQATQYYATRRGIYGAIRKHINPEYLKEIEFNYKPKVEKNDRPISKHSTTARRKPASSSNK
jgi:hypothetical protein